MILGPWPRLVLRPFVTLYLVYEIQMWDGDACCSYLRAALPGPGRTPQNGVPGDLS
jgi:hypothetical protein